MFNTFFDKTGYYQWLSWLSDWHLPGEIARISVRQVLDKIMFIKYVGRNLLELIEDTLIVAVER